MHGTEAPNAWFSRAPKARRLEPFVRRLYLIFESLYLISFLYELSIEINDMHKRRFTIFLMVVMACQFVYSGNYYVRANNGIFAIITSYQVGLTEAISFTPSSMHFNEDVLIQFVSDGSYESNFENNLTYQLFSLFWNNQDNLAIFTESGIDNQVENDFFENAALYSISFEYHSSNEDVMFDQPPQLTNQNHALESLLTTIDSSASEPITDWPCLFGCGEFLVTPGARSHHHTDRHPDKHKTLKDKCMKGFKCKYCGAVITGLQSLGTHIRRCTKAVNYLDYLD